MTRLLAPARLGVLVVAEMAAAWILVSVHTHPALAIGWRDPGGWLATTPPADVAAALAFVVAAAGTAWVTVSTVAYALVAATGAGGAVARVCARTTAPALRRLVEGALIVGLSTPGIAAAAGLPIRLSPPAPAPAPHPVAATMHSGAADVRPGTEHTVQPGDNLWTISATALRTRDPQADAGAIATYWRRVIAANAGRIRSGDPDLIYPGEIIVLP